LTLEDILQQDPHEKLELFPKLGYYFISFRAIESKAERARMQREARKHADMSGGDPDAADIPMGEANVYLVVFNDGICCVSLHSLHHADSFQYFRSFISEIYQVSIALNYFGHLG
jgi:magnesium transporter